MSSGMFTTDSLEFTKRFIGDVEAQLVRDSGLFPMITMEHVLNRVKGVVNAYVHDDDFELRNELIRVASLCLLWASGVPISHRRNGR